MQADNLEVVPVGYTSEVSLFFTQGPHSFRNVFYVLTANAVEAFGQRIWTATVFEFWYRCYPERRPYTCVWIMSFQRDMNLNSSTDESEHEWEATPPQPKRHRSLLLCGHCETHVPKSTYYGHKERFFDVISNQRQRLTETSCGIVSPVIIPAVCDYIMDTPYGPYLRA